jgi:molecular chaperone DnaK
MGKIIGIDLGTTNSVVAVMERGKPRAIDTLEGYRTMPSVVAFTESGERLVGHAARRQASANPENTIYSVSRLLGRRFIEVQNDIRRLPYKVMAAPDGSCRLLVRNKEYCPQEIAAMILRKLKEAAERFLGASVAQAVMAVPGYSNARQLQAIKDAAMIAGLEVLRLVKTPAAVALAHGLDKKGDEAIAVFDFGGGTLDISILEVGQGVVQVNSTSGDTHLGGDDFDRRVADWLIEEFFKDHRIDLSQSPMAIQRLRDAAEEAKMDLSTFSETEVNVPYITADASGAKHLRLKLSRSVFESKCQDIFQRSVQPVKQALQDAVLTQDRIDEVLLVGGSTRMPLVNQIVRDFFQCQEPRRCANPDEAVALGAAIQAGTLEGDVKDLLLLEATSLPLGVETVAGAQPLALPVETCGGVSTTLIAPNTSIPTRKNETFSTVTDNQTCVVVHVLEGNAGATAENVSLGKLELAGIPAAPRGKPQIEVTFDIDANGVLTVGVADLGTGNHVQATMGASGALTSEEIERMAMEAELHSRD